MARINYKRKPCKHYYETASGPTPCLQGALRGKNYCVRHKPQNNRITTMTPEKEAYYNIALAWSKKEAKP